MEKISDYVNIEIRNDETIIEVELETTAILTREEAIDVAKAILKHYGVTE